MGGDGNQGQLSHFQPAPRLLHTAGQYVVFLTCCALERTSRTSITIITIAFDLLEPIFLPQL